MVVRKGFFGGFLFFSKKGAIFFFVWRFFVFLKKGAIFFFFWRFFVFFLTKRLPY